MVKLSFLYKKNPLQIFHFFFIFFLKHVIKSLTKYYIIQFRICNPVLMYLYIHYVKKMRRKISTTERKLPYKCFILSFNIDTNVKNNKT